MENDIKRIINLIQEGEFLDAIEMIADSKDQSNRIQQAKVLLFQELKEGGGKKHFTAMLDLIKLEALPSAIIDELLYMENFRYLGTVLMSHKLNSNQLDFLLEHLWEKSEHSGRASQQAMLLFVTGQKVWNEKQLRTLLKLNGYMPLTHMLDMSEFKYTYNFIASLHKETEFVGTEILIQALDASYSFSAEELLKFFKLEKDKMIKDRIVRSWLKTPEITKQLKGLNINFINLIELNPDTLHYSIINKLLKKNLAELHNKEVLPIT